MRRILSGATGVTLASLLVFAGAATHAQDKKKPPEKDKKSAPDKNMALVKGKVTFKGDPIPKQKCENVANQPECAPDRRTYLTQRELVDPTTRGIANVFIYFRGPPEGMKFGPPKKSHVVAQKT